MSLRSFATSCGRVLRAHDAIRFRDATPASRLGFDGNNVLRSYIWKGTLGPRPVSPGAIRPQSAVRCGYAFRSASVADHESPEVL